MTADNSDRRARAGLPCGQRRQRGVALIEFALVFPFLLVLTLCVIDVSRAFWVKNVVTQAAREGARLLVVKTMADADEVQDRVQMILDTANVPLVACTVTAPGAAADKLRRVQVDGEFNWLFPGLFNWLGAGFTNPMTITAVTVMRSET